MRRVDRGVGPCQQLQPAPCISGLGRLRGAPREVARDCGQVGFEERVDKGIGGLAVLMNAMASEVTAANCHNYLAILLTIS